MTDRKANYLVTLVFDENSDIRKQVDTEHEFKSYIKDGLQHAIVGKEIKHFIIADDEVINKKLTEEHKVGEWVLLDECANSGYYCSECHKKLVKEGWSNTVKKIKYCPNCGADMRGNNVD